ncbi:sphingosine kinase 1 isoform X2 [Lates japonicus]|uniref:Sphingosine kinase 1 isoform X2 n=1 Tax=Lates japonicus TaxID=270547 RepID=A0AAD3N4S1_LATJO|nr:sphingosine kinase 1 isoform X2 [Lates japonicus]
MWCLISLLLIPVRAGGCQLQFCALHSARIIQAGSYVIVRLRPGVPRVRRPLRMDQRRPEPDRNTGSSPVTLYGEFTVTGNRKVRCAVSLTERDLVVQRLTSAPVGRNKVVLSLKDCVGCRAYREDDNADPAAYLSAYFYPLKRRWMSSGVARQRVEYCFRLAALQDPRANQDEAEKWARAVRERSGRQQYPRDGECSLATGGKVYCPLKQV